MMTKTASALRWAVALSALAGCVTVKPIAGPDGTEHQLVSCSRVEKCYAKAAEVCGKYTIVNASTGVHGVYGITGSDVKLLVKCEKP